MQLSKSTLNNAFKRVSEAVTDSPEIQKVCFDERDNTLSLELKSGRTFELCAKEIVYQSEMYLNEKLEAFE